MCIRNTSALFIEYLSIDARAGVHGAFTLTVCTYLALAVTFSTITTTYRLCRCTELIQQLVVIATAVINICIVLFCNTVYDGLNLIIDVVQGSGVDIRCTDILQPKEVGLCQ